MTKDELREELWDSLPWLRRSLLGRRRIDRMIESCVSQAPVQLLRHVAGRQDQIDVVTAAWRGNAKKSYCTNYGQDVIEFGPLFWIVASAVLQFLITKILEWWFDRRECRELIDAWRAETKT